MIGAYAALILALAAQHLLRDRALQFLPAFALHAAATAGWLWLVQLVREGRHRPRLRDAFLVALLLRGIVFPLAPALSDDLARYEWEGNLILHGVDPYTTAPADPAHIELRGHWHGRINHPEVPAAYPPAVQYALGFGVLLGGAPYGFKLLFGALDLLAFIVLWRWLQAGGRNPALAIVHGFCPLAVLEFAGEGHGDSLVIVAVGLALLACARGLHGTAGAALAIATAAKYWPAVLLPPLLGRARTGLLAFGAVLAVLYVPFAGPGMFGGTLEYAARWRSNEALYAPVHWLAEQLASLGLVQAIGWRWITEPQRLARLLIAIPLLAWLAGQWRRGVPAEQLGFRFLLAFLLLTPVLHPWYVAMALPLWCARPEPLLLAFTGTVYLGYMTLPGWRLEGTWEHPLWLRALEYLPLALYGFTALSRAARRSR